MGVKRPGCGVHGRVLLIEGRKFRHYFGSNPEGETILHPCLKGSTGVDPGYREEVPRFCT